MKPTFAKALATSIDDKEYTLSCVMTAEVTDRHGEIVDVETMSIDNFMLNPVVLQSHNYDKLAVGKVLSVTKTVNEQGVKEMNCVIKFAVEEYEVAKTHFELYKGGYMSAFSIGFRVGGVEQDAITNTTRLINCELLEISCVSVPANQLALAKSKGIDIDPILKTIPALELNKAICDALIDIKQLLQVKSEVIDKKDEEDKVKGTDIAKQKAKLMVEKAIRSLIHY